jgi:hypothetical protein
VARLVQGGVQESEKALVENIRAVVGSGLVELAKESAMSIGRNELHATLRLNGLQTSIGHHNDHLLAFILLNSETGRGKGDIYT